MPEIPEEYRDLFEKRTLAHVATLMGSGVPHVTPVWIDYDPERNRVLVNTERGRQKDRNVRENPAVGVSMADPDDIYRYIALIGEVDGITTDGAREHIDELSRRYTGQDYQPSIGTERVIHEIRPDRIIGR